MAAEPTTWRALLDGTANINSELKTLRLRYLTNVQGGPDGRWDVIHALAALLGLASVPPPAAVGTM